jgi:hypothetical protein
VLGAKKAENSVPVSKKTHHMPVTKMGQLLRFRKIMTVYFGNEKTHKRLNVELINVKLVV